MNAIEHKSSLSIVGFAEAIRRQVRYAQGREIGSASARDFFSASALALRERVVDAMLETEARHEKADAKRLYYLSLEFLVGRSLENNLQNLGLLEVFREALAEVGGDLEAACHSEPDAALGNGGLGRLAACFLDSLASLGLPGHGCGINYEYGLFRQEIEDGEQREHPDNWLAFGTPWEIEQPSEAVQVPCFGRIEHTTDVAGNYNPVWLDWTTVIGVPHDFPIVGYGGSTVNRLRLFSARASHDFDMRVFNAGDYVNAVQQKMTSETVSKVLYPSDSVAQGRELRLVQEWFLVACSVRDAVRRFQKTQRDFNLFPEKVAFQLNDTHPALTVLELMRLLVDEQAMPWALAWKITQATCAYTNHTLMPEALERWDLPLFEKVLPRHTQILFEVNRRFLDEVAIFSPGDDAKAARMSLIEEGEPKHVRMAHVSIVGSHSVNGVAALHSELVKTTLVPDFAALWPERFNNKTNGVTPRRWILTANPGLAKVLDRELGTAWPIDFPSLIGLVPRATDAAFQEEMIAVKQHNKGRLAKLVFETTRIRLDEHSQFDIQVKRIHEYKRQLLNAMHVAWQYLALVEDGITPPVPKSYIFAGKAAPGYHSAKQIIRLIHALADTINSDPRAADWLRVAFVPDYRVSIAEVIIPAGDLSEQISTAGTEASGTSNMKLALNGALTMGTMDGANIEIFEAVGAENGYIFGLSTDEVETAKREGSYRSADLYHDDPTIRRVIDAIAGGRFSPGDPGLFAWLKERLVDEGDRYFHLADFHSYRKAQEKAGLDYQNKCDWARRSILNIARSAKFSSDRTIREYARDIWNLKTI